MAKRLRFLLAQDSASGQNGQRMYLERVCLPALLVLSLLVLSFVTGCDDQPSETQVACDAYIDSLECGDFPVESLYVAGYCDDYHREDAETTEMFECLMANTSCVLGDPVHGDYVDIGQHSNCINTDVCPGVRAIAR